MARAYVNWGRWIVNCPTEQCRGAELAHPGSDLVQCAFCKHIIDVTHPANYRQVEELLLMREQKNQHWHPDQTLRDLVVENKDHGLIVRLGGK